MQRIDLVADYCFYDAVLTPNKSSASEEKSIDSFVIEDISLEKPESSLPIKNLQTEPSNEVGINMVNPYRYTKENVKITYEWSSYKRVSNNLTTGSKEGSITSNKSVTFSPVISGAISGINVSLGSSKTSSIGYTLNVGAYKSVYMGYRVRYEVEKGTRVRTDVATGAKVKNSYTVKRPLYGDYKLINY